MSYGLYKGSANHLVLYPRDKKEKEKKKEMKKEV